MSKRKRLHEEFYNDEPEHFTNYDYILQLVENGQLSTFKEFIKEIVAMDLLNILTNNSEIKDTYLFHIKEEILERLIA